MTVLAVVAPMLVVLFVMLGAQVLGARRAQRKNDRIQREYREACARAKADGRCIPFPPNIIRFE